LYIKVAVVKKCVSRKVNLHLWCYKFTLSYAVLTILFASYAWVQFVVFVLLYMSFRHLSVYNNFKLNQYFYHILILFNK